VEFILTWVLMVRECPLMTDDPLRPCPAVTQYLPQEFPTRAACEEVRQEHPQSLVCEERARVKQ